MPRNPRRVRPERSIPDILTDPEAVALLQAVRDGRITRSGQGGTAAHLLDGRPVKLQLRRLADEDRVWIPMLGLPRLCGDAAEILRRAEA